MIPDEDRSRERELARGEWWLPAFPDKRLHGTLTLLADHRTRLDLFGQFPELPEGGYGVVLGETDGEHA